MNSTKYQELFKLVQKADRYKNQSFFDKELDIYKEIHEKYIPNTSTLFKRPAILYEKKGEFQKALDLCLEAITLIEDDKISGTADSFEKMKIILERKLNDKKDAQKDNVKKFIIPTISISSVIIILTVILAMFFLSTKENSYDNLEIDLTAMKKESSLDGSLFEENDEPNQYPITKDMIKNARNSINSDAIVVNSVILNDNTSIGFGILVKNGTSYSKSKTLSTKFIKSLGNIAASEYNLAPSNMSSIGEIYDYYSIYISVGISNKAEDILLKGYRKKHGGDIIYK